MSETYGSQTSEFPDDVPTFTAQSEALDPASEDSTLAEGRDANKWSAEIRAIAQTIGSGGRAKVSVSGSTATVEPLDYVYEGTFREYAGTTSLSLYAGQTNYIYLDMITETETVSTSGWPTSPHIRLAKWIGPTNTLTDERPHDLKPSGAKPIFGTTAGWKIDAGSVTITSGNTTATITFNITFSSLLSIVGTGRVPSDSTIREVAFSNETTTQITVNIDVAAPAAGVVVNWQAVGVEDTSSSSGSGSS